MVLLSAGVRYDCGVSGVATLSPGMRCDWGMMLLSPGVRSDCGVSVTMLLSQGLDNAATQTPIT